MSKDNIPFNISLTILYKFDPIDSPDHIIAQFAIAPDQVLENIVKDYGSRGLRRLAARYRAETLCGERPMSRIENSLNAYLNSELEILGIQLLKEGSVLIREALPPEKFRHTMLSLNVHQATLRVLASFDKYPALIKQALQAEFISNLENLDNNFMFVSNMEALDEGQKLEQFERMFAKNGQY